MRCCLFGNREFGVVEKDQVYPVGRALTARSFINRAYTMVDVIFYYGIRKSVRQAISEAIKNGSSIPLTETTLLAPVLNPGKIWATEANYSEVIESAADPVTLMRRSFLKPASSIIGPNDTIELPNSKSPLARSAEFQTDLCVVIGKKAKRISEAEALNCIFGYTICLDVGQVDPSSSKSLGRGFDTFTPLGPWIVTTDEIPDPQNLNIKLWYNGVLKQHGNTKDMLCTVRQFVSFFSNIGTLYPGDLIITAIPKGLAIVKAGDVLKIQIEKIGQMQLDVTSG